METIRFIHMSDLHYRIKYSNHGVEALIAHRHPEENLLKCIKTEKEKGIDFVLITGDLTHEGDDEDYQAIQYILKEQLGEVPYIALPGNHDRRDAFCRGFLNLEPRKSLDMVYHVNGLRTIVIDTGRSVNGVITKDQIRWLSSVVAKTNQYGSILALHHPLIEGQDGLPRADYNDELYEVIEKSDIRGIFCGHTHHNYIASFASKPYFTADALSFSMTSIDNNLQFEDSAAYSIMKLHDTILSAQVKQVVPAPAVIASFSSDKLSQLFS